MFKFSSMSPWQNGHLTIGITDAPPHTWKKLEPIWEDEQLIASSSHSFYSVISKLCETTIKNCRKYDHGFDDRWWSIKIMYFEDAVNPPDCNHLKRMFGSDVTTVMMKMMQMRESIEGHCSEVSG